MIRFKPEWRVPSLIGVGSFCIGSGLGYILGKRRSTEIITVEEETDVEQLQFQFDFAKKEMYEDLDRKVNTLIRLVDDIRETLGQEPLRLSRSEQVAQQMHEHVVQHPVSPEPDDEWDYEVEMRNRSEDRPYTIHQDEFLANEKDYRQVTLTYYAGDDVLTDELDVPIYNPGTIVGQLKFGHGSHDNMVVYVRNDSLEAEYEIQLEPGKYSVEILGAKAEEDILDENIKHGNAIHKFHKD